MHEGECFAKWCEYIMRRASGVLNVWSVAFCLEQRFWCSLSGGEIFLFGAKRRPDGVVVGLLCVVVSFVLRQRI